MADKLRELRKRISKLPSSELLKIVNNTGEGYRGEAVLFAKQELEARGPVSFQETDTKSDSQVGEVPGEPHRCRACGGAMRAGLLSRGKELMITFTDADEERYLDALACTTCGEVRLVVDFETDV